MKIKPYQVDYKKLTAMRDKTRIDLSGNSKKYNVDAKLKAAAARVKSKTTGGKQQINVNKQALFQMKLRTQMLTSGVSLLTMKPQLPDISAFYSANMPNKPF